MRTSPFLVLLLLLNSAALAQEAKDSAGAAGFHQDIEYGRAGKEPLLLDAWVPRQDGPYPMAIVVHGGGWGSGDKQKDLGPITESLTKANFTWFSINYRLAPKHRWPACLEDVQAAIRWVKAHAVEYQGDSSRLALIGYSAGGQLVCQAAVLANEATRVQAVVGLAPPTDLWLDTERRGELSKSLQDLLNRQAVNDETRTTLREISPINYLKQGLPPFLLIHGTADKSVPLQQSLNFQKELKKLGVPCELVTLEDAPHRIGDWSKFDSAYTEKMVHWLRQSLKITGED